MGGGNTRLPPGFRAGRGECGARTIRGEENDLLSLVPHLGSRQAESLHREVGERVSSACCNAPREKRLPDVQRC